MHILIAPDKLRGTYTAAEAARALAGGWAAVRPDDALELVPLADGGEGTAAALLAAAGGEWAEADVHDALGRPCRARFALLADGAAAVDVAEAVGALRVADRPAQPVDASSRGAGELIRAAIEAGARRIIVGVGGTATTDGGAGLRDALGDLPAGIELVAALDVRNPLLGADGAAAVYGPQKGATADQVRELEARLEALALPTAGLPGAGAGGGIGAMLMALGAAAASGGALVMEAAGLDRRLAEADRCLTAEGRIDMQTLSGKVVALVAERCRLAGVPCTAVGGAVERPAAAALGRIGCVTHRRGDLELAGRELATAWPGS
ncbi:MAG TPA: glycerate kinase [Gaiellales bacterium]|jgi:glycerate kinase|nr:glycerate kinase [Gaiellales bacterium]